MSPLDSIHIHDPDTILEHNKKCCVGMGDMHAADTIADIFDVSCSERIFELDQVLLDDPAIFFRQVVNVLQYVPLDFEVQTASPHPVSGRIRHHCPCGRIRHPVQPE